ncbi:MAG: DUF4412 domain-containing protein [Gemmatimonadota bacterium]|nr:DUF4412 domain-containing protein [Gemmatimonadota bacterium]MDH5759051.1 DUF4412 domain-containing protein [Gemmatimonadota bacterium]
MNVRTAVLAVVVSILALPAVAPAQSFEGVIRQRTIEVDEDGIFQILYADDYEEPDFDSEEEWVRHTSARLFAIDPTDLSTGFDGAARVEETTVWVKGNKIRFDVAADQGGGYVIIDADVSTTWIVNPADRSYFEFTAAEMEEATDRAMSEAEEMMARMGIDPDEMAAMAEEMGAGMERETPTVRSLGRAETVNGFGATGFTGSSESQTGVAWCARDESGVSEALSALAKRAGMEDDEEDEFATGWAGDELCEGTVPVRTQVWYHAAMGASYTVEDILSLKREPVGDDRFLIPAGYTMKSLSDLWR